MQEASRSTLRPQKTAVLVARRIVEDIKRDNKKVGDRLPSEKLMLVDYQVGRGTLRESLRFLEIQGLISLKPGPRGGPVVEQPTGMGLAIAMTLLMQFENAPYRDIMEARHGLEPLIARLAASRMSEEQLTELQKNVELTKEALEDEGTFLTLNQEFHDLISRGSGNALFHHLIDAMNGILDGTAVGVAYPRKQRIAIHEAHARVLHALVERNGDAAGDAMGFHISEYATYVEKKFPELMSAPIVWVN